MTSAEDAGRIVADRARRRPVARSVRHPEAQLAQPNCQGDACVAGSVDESQLSDAGRIDATVFRHLPKPRSAMPGFREWEMPDSDNFWRRRVARVRDSRGV